MAHPTKHPLPLIAAAALAGCATLPPGPGAPVAVKIIAFNDLHGNLEPPKLTVDDPAPGAAAVKVPAGGVAYLASAIDRLRAANPNHAIVSAGDMIGASPMMSSMFLDEPTIAAMNLIRIDFNAVGNHEFDRGSAELLRMQKGGCEKHTALTPCRLEPFRGADFRFLAANVATADGATLFPPYAVRSFGRGRARVKVGFIGMTLKETPTLVTPTGVANLSFLDEADTANALVPRLRAEGAEAIVLLIHQGAWTKGGYNDKSCPELSGELLPILDRLDPAVDVVVSGHTHAAYVCDYGRINPARPFLLTSAGRYGTILTDIALSIDPATGDVTARSADNVIVRSEGFTPSAGTMAAAPLPGNEAVAALVQRYAAATAPLAARVVGRLTGPALRAQIPTRETVLGDLVADAQLAATRAPGAGGARIAFMNPGGVRADITPAADGSVSYGQLFAAQPFGNSVMVKSFTGRQIRAILEQQFNSGSNSVERPYVLLPSNNFRYGYDLSKPAGQRIVNPRIDGAPLDDNAVYRVAMNNFLANGGDNFTLFREGTDPAGGPQDIDALEAYIAAASPLTPPTPDRITDLTPR